MKDKVFKIVNLILALFLAVFSISYVFAWFADGTKVPLNVDGQATAYFAYGDGTEEKPFGITEPVHLYNLAWLQNSGQFSSLNTANNSNDIYYFELAADIDMTSYVIAPIGNYDNPFMGVFNGNGHTISNLVVTTNKNSLRSSDSAAQQGYEFSHAVGFFGYTENYSDYISRDTSSTEGDSGETETTTSGCDIKNFILDNPVVEVSSTNTLYESSESTTSGTTTTPTNTYAGLAIGYVSNAASSIGVRGGKLSCDVNGYTTYNSILGNIADGVDSDLTGNVTAGDTGYFVPELILTEAQEDSSTYLGVDDKGNATNYFKENIVLRSQSTTNANGDMKLGAFSIINKNQFYIDDNRALNWIRLYTAPTNDGTYGVGAKLTTEGNVDTINTYLSENNHDPMYNVAGSTVNDKFPLMTQTDLKNTVRYNGAADILSTANEYNVVYEKTNGIYPSSTNLPTTASYFIEDAIEISITSASTESPAEIFILLSSSNNNSRPFILSTFDSDKKTFTQVARISLGQFQESSTLNVGYACIIKITEPDNYYLYCVDSGSVSIHYLAVKGTPSGQSAGQVADTGVSAVDFIYSNVAITQTAIGTEGQTGYIAAFNFIDITDNDFYIPTGARVQITTATTVAFVLLFDNRVTNHALQITWSGVEPTASYDSEYIDIVEQTTDGS